MSQVYKTLFILAVASLALADADDAFEDGGASITPSPSTLAAASQTIGTSMSSTVAGIIITTATRAAEVGQTGDSETGGDGGDGGGEDGWYESLVSAHGFAGVLAFAVMFPLGGIIIRLLKNSLWKHAGMMLTAYTAALFTLGTGIWIAEQEGDMGEGHAIIGIVVISGLFLQPFTGYIHHKLFVKTGGRTSVSYIHMWVGIPLITFGIVNGLLGLRLADKGTLAQAAYAVVTVLIWMGWMTVSFIANRRRARAAAEKEGIRMQKVVPDSRPNTGSETTNNGFAAHPGSFGDHTYPMPAPQADYVPYIPPAVGNGARV